MHRQNDHVHNFTAMISSIPLPKLPAFPTKIRIDDAIHCHKDHLDSFQHGLRRCSHDPDTPLRTNDINRNNLHVRSIHKTCANLDLRTHGSSRLFVFGFSSHILPFPSFRNRRLWHILKTMCSQFVHQRRRCHLQRQPVSIVRGVRVFLHPPEITTSPDE